jgi:anti-anti-sigma factor
MQREPTRIDVQGIRAPRAFSISDEPVGEAVAVRLEGELDLAASAALRARVDSTAGRPLLLDFEHVTFLDSSALRELLRARADLAARGDCLLIAGPSPAVLRLFELTHTLELFEIEPTRESALRRLGLSDRPGPG